MTFKMEVTKERLREVFRNNSQKDVGEKLNMTQGNVSKLLTGKQQPTIDTIFQIAEAYDVSADWLLGLTEEKKVAKQDMSYGDILKMFTALGERGALWPIPCNMISADGTDLELPMIIQIGINDEILQSILYEWKKVAQNPEDIYRMWLNKRIKEYSEIDYISWDENTKQLFYEYRQPEGISYEFLKKFYDIYKERSCQENETK